MGRSVPESIANPEVQCIAFWPTDYAIFQAKGAEAVQNYGTGSPSVGSRGELPSEGDSFTWRSGGDLFEYTLTCAGDGGIVDGYMPVNDWYLSQKPLTGTGQARNYFYSVAECHVLVMEDDCSREPTFREVAELSDALLDMADELNIRRTQNRYHYVGGRLFPNIHYVRPRPGTGED